MAAAWRGLATGRHGRCRSMPASKRLAWYLPARVECWTGYFLWVGLAATLRWTAGRPTERHRTVPAGPWAAMQNSRRCDRSDGECRHARFALPQVKITAQPALAMRVRAFAPLRRPLTRPNCEVASSVPAAPLLQTHNRAAVQISTNSTLRCWWMLAGRLG